MMNRPAIPITPEQMSAHRLRQSSIASVTSVQSSSHESEPNPFETNFGKYLQMSTSPSPPRPATRPLSLDHFSFRMAGATDVSRKSSISSVCSISPRSLPPTSTQPPHRPPRH